MNKKILINENPWQTRVAITRDDELQNIYFWAHSTENLERSFFKGVVTKILPGIQTAFVDIGQERAGFLHISEIDRELAVQRMHDQFEEVEENAPQKTIRREQIDISNIISEGENILVQVNKEPVKEKGAKLTTCFTLPGRFLVLMPNIGRIGISKKIESKEERQRLKELLTENLPQGMGAIIRTPSEKQGAEEILQDLYYLIAAWKTITKKFSEAQPKEKIYEDIDLSLQAVRDHLDHDVEAVISDNSESQSTLYKFVKNIAPEHVHKIQLYQGPPSLFEKYNIENQIEQALQRKVYLKSGGSIIIETTEAMTVVDVNTGRYIGKNNLEETILKTNLEAAEAVVRQLRLRNIGGLIVIDFIDMGSSANKQKLSRFFEKTLKERDKFQSVVLKVSEFGLVQMTRKRSGKTLINQLMHQCNSCNGFGFVKSVSNESYTILRGLKQELASKKVPSFITLSLHPATFNYITSIEYNTILRLEKTYKCKIVFMSKETCAIHDYKIEFN
ncbi:Rne/Rng family ribonuclease [Candidatus Dependentiae bacterium]|nr:Rne/Rng family ribonuclease [Candidatus Dependentiae bacterium]